MDLDKLTMEHWFLNASTFSSFFFFVPKSQPYGIEFTILYFYRVCCLFFVCVVFNVPTYLPTLDCQESNSRISKDKTRLQSIFFVSTEKTFSRCNRFVGTSSLYISKYVYHQQTLLKMLTKETPRPLSRIKGTKIFLNTQGFCTWRLVPPLVHVGY